MFEKQLLELPKLTRIDGEQRHYLTPNGEKYPSVTTIISEMSDKTALYEWRRRVGEEEANRISSSASTRGTGTHALCERFLLGEDLCLDQMSNLDIELFSQLKPILSQHVNNILAIEASLFSHKLRAAGSVDLIAKYKGEPAIVDFKTSLRPKLKRYIENYFIQATMYAIMLHEMTGIVAKDIVIMIAIEDCEGERGIQVFEERTRNFYHKAMNYSVAFHKKREDKALIEATNGIQQ